MEGFFTFYIIGFYIIGYIFEGKKLFFMGWDYKKNNKKMGGDSLGGRVEAQGDSIWGNTVTVMPRFAAVQYSVCFCFRLNSRLHIWG